MVATTDETFKPEKTRAQTDLWVLAMVSCVALVCVSILAVALAMVLSKGSLPSISVSPVFNPGSGAAPASPVVAPVQQTENPVVDRGVVPQEAPAALPIAPALVREPETASAPPVESAPPAEVSPSEDLFQVRGEAPSYYTGTQALPMPVRRSGAPAPSVAKEAPVEAAAPASSWSDSEELPADIPAAKAVPAVPPIPAVPRAAAAPVSPVGPGLFARASVQGISANLRLLAARSTARLVGFSPSQGNLFFTAHVLIHNTGAKAMSVDEDAFDLRDLDGEDYMATPPASGSAPLSLASGGRATMDVSFLVPDDAALHSLILALPSENIVIPLSKQ